MSEKNICAKQFAYILIVDNDKTFQESAIHSIGVPNCAIDVARDEDEAVHKALQHRPQLIVVKQHEPLNINVWTPPKPSAASLICRRARLTTAVRLVTHSDVAVTAHLAMIPDNKQSPMTPILQQRIAQLGLDRRLFSNPQQPILVRPKFVGQDWRKEWYLYCSRDQMTEFLSHHIPFLLGWVHLPLFSGIRIHDLGVVQKQGDVLMVRPPYYLSFNESRDQKVSCRIYSLSTFG
jgi:CheY-like chemotaxis protein